MPLIRIEVLEGTLTEEAKKEMISKVSNIVAEIEARPHPKEKLLPHTWCIIEEVPPAKWGIGGQPLSLETLKALLSG
ncbi:MAG: tautomerase family protein [Syntrophobacteraceae bacterium]|jgi:4-oxalocrotonate tautomerase family enzyme